MTPEQIELVRRGLWKVVNEDGGTGGRARLKNVQVAGKTGTAQATDRGQEENVAWFVSFAPYDNPKYVVAVMVQGASGHGGEVAAPIATRILERIVEMDEGNFDMQVAWVAPAHHDNPFELIKSVAFKDSNVGGGEDEEDAGTSSADVQMASGGGEPDVEQAPDAEGRVAPRQTRVARAQSVTTPPPERRGFFQRLFGRRSTPAPAPTPTPSRRSRGF